MSYYCGASMSFGVGRSLKHSMEPAHTPTAPVAKEGPHPAKLWRFSLSPSPPPPPFRSSNTPSISTDHRPHFKFKHDPGHHHGFSKSAVGREHVKHTHLPAALTWHRHCLHG